MMILFAVVLPFRNVKRVRKSNKKDYSKKQTAQWRFNPIEVI